MAERLADVTERIQAIQQLGSVVNAMTGMAATRAHQARDQLAAVDSYAATIAAAILQASMLGRMEATTTWQKERMGLLVFCAEQGFAGAFSEKVLDGAGGDLRKSDVFLIGTKGKAVAAERDLTPVWSAVMPSHSHSIPKLANDTLNALFAKINAGKMDRVDAVFPIWTSGTVAISRRQLYPVKLDYHLKPAGPGPLSNLPFPDLLASLSADYFFSQICNVALHAFAAENEARMAAMSAAQNQIENELALNKALERRVRQEAITAEIIELASGEHASRKNRAASKDG